MASPIVFAAPAVPEAIPAALRPGMQMRWDGWDGSRWDIATGNQGIALLPGTRGFNMPPTKRFTATSPAIHGSRATGWITNEREVFWALAIYDDPANPDWIALDRAFWRTMHPAKPGLWTVTQPSGESRHLSCTFDNDGDHTTDILPAVRGWEKYGITLAATQPFWEGDPIVKTWGARPPVNFFDPALVDRVVTISSASTLGSAQALNPGDVDAWPVWTIIGDATNAAVEVNGARIEIPFAIPPGKCVVIDTNPKDQRCLFGDWVAAPGGGYAQNLTDRFSELGRAEFNPIPAGPAVPVNLTINGNGSGAASCVVKPLYFRAW